MDLKCQSLFPKLAVSQVLYIHHITSKSSFRYVYPSSSCTSLHRLQLRHISAMQKTKDHLCQSETKKKEVGIQENDEKLSVIESALTSKGNFAILSSCLVGLLTGIAVVIFNNSVHEIRDIFWDGIPARGASWLREEPIEVIWKRVVFVPVCGGLIVSVLNVIRSSLDEDSEERLMLSNVKVVLRPFLKAVAACVTLGTGNSLGPEGPSVEIGSSIAKGVGSFVDKNAQRRMSLLAAGAAAGISSGFNAAVAGCFFAVESVLWPSPAESSSSLTNTTSMVILSAVVASVVSEVGLGSEPAFKVPDYDFGSLGELPLYLLLGMLCGLVSISLSRCTSYMLLFFDSIHKNNGIPKAFFPLMGGLAIGLIASAYPEILYWGFENVDILIESRPFVKGLSADLLLQLVAVKVVATSLCRASCLVGGYYAPSLFIGAATGMAYGKFISIAVAQANPLFNLSVLEVASPQAYGLVGMAATLAGVCQVPLTAVLLLFELTQDYRIVLPLLGAVVVSSWITSGQTKRDSRETGKFEQGDGIQDSDIPSSNATTTTLLNCYAISKDDSNSSNLCDVESSLCFDEMVFESEGLKSIPVSEAMRTRYATVLMSTSLPEALTLMVAEKQPCALIVDTENLLIGLLTLGDIQAFCKAASKHRPGSKELLVSELFSLSGKKCQIPWAATPDMNLIFALKFLNKCGLNHAPVVSEHIGDYRGHPVGIIDRESILLTCRALATRHSLR